ncbi:MAG: hypothetical protein P8R37_00375 [Opitutae bacterium]|nr:hypothetical protein [Opitutae bacterium]MDG1300027.1 hypothetical protein [Opitutae bacterium]
MKISIARYNMTQLGALGVLTLAWLIGSANVFAQSVSEIRVIEESAISYTGFLSKARFDQRFSGQMKADTADLDSGWYVIYEHEGLSYYFGPILLESTGQDYLAQLTKVVESAVQQRPSIVGYRLELSFEPSEVAQTARARSSASDNVESGDRTPPPPSFDIWGFVRSVFGL